MSISVQQHDLTQIKCDAIINPANSYGYMGGGVAGAIKKKGGTEIEKEAIDKAPIKVGRAIYTSAGILPNKYVIHASTMRKPAMRTKIEYIKIATKAALKLANELEIKTIAIPGMGTGVGGIAFDDAAEAMMEIIRDFEDKFEKIYLVDRNKDMINSFQKYLK